MLSWIVRTKTTPAVFITSDISQLEQDYSIIMQSASNNEITLPKLILKGTLISDNQIPKALLIINNQSAKWYQQGEEVQPGLRITKIDSSSALLKQGMAYYEFYLSNQ